MIMRIKNSILVNHGCIDRRNNVIVGIGDGGWWRNDVVVTITPMMRTMEEINTVRKIAQFILMIDYF